MSRLGALSLALVFVTSHLHAQSVKVSVIDRGQADGVVIRTPNHQWVVIDGGTNRQQADLMEDWDIDTVALAVVSHRHFDHNGGMDDVLRSFTVLRYIGRLDDCHGVVQDNTIRDILSDRGIPSEEPAGQAITVDGVTFTVLPTDPVDDDCPDDENDNSVVVRLDYGDFSMLFTGDAEDGQRDWLVGHHDTLVDVDVLKASHHGADNGVSDTWLDAVTPERVVISAGVNATYGHPQANAVAAYTQAVGRATRVYCTNRHKTVTVYGREDGGIMVRRMNPIDKSCVYDGTHY